MAEKKVPMRRCAGCGQSKPKKELIRIVCGEDGIKADPCSKLPGRGVYICRSEDCLTAAVKRNGFARSLKRPVGKETLDELSSVLSEIIKA